MIKGECYKLIESNTQRPITATNDMLEAFKSDVSVLRSSDLINKYYLSGPAFALDDDRHYRLRSDVSKYFTVEFTDVFLVGSAKLGFSIKPSRRFLPFGDKSDLDLVIVSKLLFENIWKEVFTFEKTGGYWPKMDAFKRYHFQGWIRPDMLPLDKAFPITRHWWSFFEDLSAAGHFGPYKVRGGLYYSRAFFDSYQQICFDECRSETVI